ncbi:reprolysin-like metallopeptidase [uncultured Polaribacter sp.]|uniref:reprolysin-like metallopeptidase n=1 Tax=uncultured Polaribacter sp. TaxID=174711 RepID=UPI002630101C|nr:zinc-dependent metalloprotease family protein [uncultured Polaribacter sp.]
MQNIINLPNAEGVLSRFIINETSNFEADLSEKFPMIKSYSAQGLDDPTAVAKISIGTDGFHAVVLSGTKNTVYIDPYSKGNETLMVYNRNDLEPNKDNFTCKVEEFTTESLAKTKSVQTANDGVLRTFRLAVVCSGEYAQFHLTNQGISTAAADVVKKAAVLSAMNTTLTRVNGIFERDLSVKMVLVNDNDKVVFLDPETDNITDGDPEIMLNEVQSICDTEIGNLNYDIGHIFSTGGDGIAGGGIVCITGQKAKGVTGRSEPIGDAYDIDFVVHELGHQFGANHTQNNNCNRNNSTAVEPGSGSTIMGYAGICSPNVQGQSNDYFHAISIAEMWGVIQSSATCGSIVSTGNTAPIANAGPDFSIPKSTPFILKGTASDVDGVATLTYNWEQIDNQLALMPPISSSVRGPMFRSLASKSEPIRYMPELATVIAGNTSSTWEVVPSVERDLNFSFLVRDNHFGGGSTAKDEMKVSVEDAEPFTVLAINSELSWGVGTTQTVTWVKGTTDVAPINCLNVNIKLSLDGGLTFPIILKENTPNDGTEVIVIPNNTSNQARIMVEASDNIFYNVNPSNFTIFNQFLLTNTSASQQACGSVNQEVTYFLDVSFASNFNEIISFSTTGQPLGSSVAFNPSTISSEETVAVTISNLNGVTPKSYSINLVANSNSVNKSTELQLDILNPTISNLTLTSPTNNALDISLDSFLRWNANADATNYNVQVATDSSFSTIILEENVTTNQYSLSNLTGNTLYYWRVQPKNTCGEGVFSNVFNFKTTIPPYCTSTFTDDFGGTEHITNVIFNSIDNTSGNAPFRIGYEDFTELQTTVVRGDTHEITVCLDTGGFQDHIYVFIDWNQDFMFDKFSERYDLGTVFYDEVNDSPLGSKQFPILIPEDAKTGSTTMRVVIEYDDLSDGFGEGACDTDHLTEFGETEDYTIVIDSVASIKDIAFENFNLYPNPTKGAFNLKLKVVNTESLSVQLFDLRGRLIDQKQYFNINENFLEKIFFNKASAGLYLLKVINGNIQTTRKLIIE